MDRARPRLRELLDAVAGGCSACGICVQECGFLERHGAPIDIAKGYDAAGSRKLTMPFECSLCSLCTEVCPSGVNPQALFLEMRREAVDRCAAPLPAHRGLLGYERVGISPLFSWYGLPPGCDTVFFPGCALPGSRPDTTWKVFRRLQEAIPSLGIMLDCCTKPSHDSGREAYFADRLGELRNYFRAHGVRRLLVACPNCWKVFTEYVPEVRVETVYEILSAPGVGAAGELTIHDPCVLRFAKGPQEAVRRLAREAGGEVVEMQHSRESTLCCGEGGNVGAVDPTLALEWGNRRAAEAGGRRVVTYCAGCANFLSARAPVSHILDLIVDPPRALAGRTRVSSGWMTYWNRLRLKMRLKRAVSARVTGDRRSAAALSRRESKPPGGTRR